MKRNDTKLSSFSSIFNLIFLLFSSNVIATESLSTTNTNPSAELGISLYSDSISYDRIEFNLQSKTVTKYLNASTTRRIAKINADTFIIENWKQQYLPLLNGLPIKIAGKSQTISINESETQFFIATDKEQALLSNNGNVIWKHNTSTLVSEAIISDDDQFIIVRDENNIISWIDYKTGLILYSLYIKPETLEWLIWTVDGYYDSSSPEFEPITIDNKYISSVNFPQLRHYLFNPHFITNAINNDTYDSSNLKTLSNSKAPKIDTLDEEDSDNSSDIAFCITHDNQSQIRVLFYINGTVVQRKTTPTLSIEKKNHCSHIINFSKPQFLSDYNLSARALDLDTNIWSEKHNQEVSEEIENIKGDNTKLIFINDRSNRLNNERTQSSLNHLFNKSTLFPIDLSPKKTVKVNNNPASNKSDAFIMYLSTKCRVTDDEVFFSANKSNKKAMTLSHLKNKLQATKNPQSIIFIDCLVSENINSDITKKLTHDFMFKTGRTLLVQFSNENTLKESGLKQSYMMTTLEQAASGDADKNDDLLIDSNELMDYMTATLPEVTFEGSGDYGTIYSQVRRGNVFKLPIEITE